MNLTKARKKHGLTLEQLAKLVGSNKGHLSAIANGRKRPSFELAVRLRRVLPELDIETMIKDESAA